MIFAHNLFPKQNSFSYFCLFFLAFCVVCSLLSNFERASSSFARNLCALHTVCCYLPFSMSVVFCCCCCCCWSEAHVKCFFVFAHYTFEFWLVLNSFLLDTLRIQHRIHLNAPFHLELISHLCHDLWLFISFREFKVNFYSSTQRAMLVGC